MQTNHTVAFDSLGSAGSVIGERCLLVSPDWISLHLYSHLSHCHEKELHFSTGYCRSDEYSSCSHWRKHRKHLLLNLLNTSRK